MWVASKHTTGSEPEVASTVETEWVNGSGSVTLKALARSSFTGGAANIGSAMTTAAATARSLNPRFRWLVVVVSLVWNIGFMVGCFELSVVLRMRGTLNPAASVRERPSLCFLRTKARTLPSFSFLAFSLDQCAVEMCSR